MNLKELRLEFASGTQFSLYSTNFPSYFLYSKVVETTELQELQVLASLHHFELLGSSISGEIGLRLVCRFFENEASAGEGDAEAWSHDQQGKLSR